MSFNKKLVAIALLSIMAAACSKKSNNTPAKPAAQNLTEERACSADSVAKLVSQDLGFVATELEIPVSDEQNIKLPITLSFNADDASQSYSTMIEHDQSPNQTKKNNFGYNMQIACVDNCNTVIAYVMVPFNQGRENIKGHYYGATAYYFSKSSEATIAKSEDGSANEVTYRLAYQDSSEDINLEKAIEDASELKSRGIISCTK